MAMTEKQRKELRTMRSAIDAAISALDDKTASQVAILYPTMPRDGGLIKAGTRIRWRGENGKEELRKAKGPLWARTDQDPAHAPDMWAHVMRHGSEILGEIGEGKDKA